MFRVDRLELRDFRSYRHADVSFAPGLNAIIGPNGHGKTNLLEAVHFVGTLRSLRNSPPEALVANGADEAIIRAAVNVDERDVLIESAIAASGRQRTQVNRHGGARRRDLGEVIQTIVFSPDDLDLVKGPPSGRRELVDDLAVSCRPAAADDLRTLERVLKQRNALLKQAGGRVTPEVALSLDVWDERLAVAGDLIGTQRRDLVVALAPHVTEAYHRIAGSDVAVRISYEPEWLVDGLASALARSRTDELRRGVSLVGPHRDDLTLRLASMSARTHASQGEQRSLALALRLASHRLVTESRGHAPILLLDDVFSELDPQRSAALFAALPNCQTLMATAVALPAHAGQPEQVLTVTDGRVGTSSDPPVASGR